MVGASSNCQREDRFADPATGAALHRARGPDLDHLLCSWRFYFITHSLRNKLYRYITKYINNFPSHQSMYLHFFFNSPPENFYLKFNLSFYKVIFYILNHILISSRFIRFQIPTLVYVPNPVYYRNTYLLYHLYGRG